MGFRENMEAAKKNRDQGGSFESLPLGRYNVVLYSAFRNQSKAGNSQVCIDWAILEGEYSGKKERQFHRLEGNRCDISISIMCNELTLLGVDAFGFESEQDMDKCLQALTNKHPMATLVVFKKKDYVNKKVETYLGDYEGDINDLVPDAKPSTTTKTSAPEEEAAIEIVEGAKFKYKKDGKEHVGKIVKLNHDKGTIDFPFHKGIEVSDLICSVID